MLHCSSLLEREIMRDRKTKVIQTIEWTTMKRIFSLFLICMLAFSTLSNMIVSAESKSTGTFNDSQV